MDWCRFSAANSLFIRFLLTGCGAAIASPGFAGATYECVIESAYSLEVRSPVVGRLQKVHVARGEIVTAGQAVATLESTVEQASAELALYKSKMTGPLLSAQNKLEFASRKFQRHEGMYNENFISAQERDDAEAERKLAEAELQLAQENKQLAQLEWQQQSSTLALRTISSPLTGVVVEQALYPGEVVEPGVQQKPILKLAQLDPLRVHVVLPLSAFGQVKPGMGVTVVPEPPIKGRHKAVVKMVDRVVDAASGTFVVFLELPNRKFHVPAGVKCRAEFPFGEASGKEVKTGN